MNSPTIFLLRKNILKLGVSLRTFKNYQNEKDFYQMTKKEVIILYTL